MKDDLDIREGGVIAVDTADLRAAASALQSLGSECARLAERLRAVGGELENVGIWLPPPARRVDGLGETATALSTDLRTMADTYELVELYAQAAMAAASGDDRAAATLLARAKMLAATDPHRALRAMDEWIRWRHRTADEMSAQIDGSVFTTIDGTSHGPIGALFAGLTGLVAAVGRGTLTPNARLEGPAVPVRAVPLRAGRGAAPATVADLAARIPQGEARVRVETYSFPDGTRRFVAYAAGTSDGGKSEAWDWDSNIRMYFGQRAASFGALEQAIAHAGAEPGDTVSLVGYSQGAMATTHLALSGTYEVPWAVGIGAPVVTDLGDDTVNVILRHGDDTVAALAGGGLPYAGGADGSVAISRTTPESIVRGEALLAPHSLAEYRETAALVDASPDPRLAPLRDELALLSQASAVTVSVYGAERLLSGGTSSAGAEATPRKSH